MNPLQEQMLAETHQTVTQLKTILIGMNGDQGLVGEVKCVKREVETLGSKHDKLSRSFWLLVGVLTGSGVIAGGVWGIVQNLP
jgi:hypothetical protein